MTKRRRKDEPDLVGELQDQANWSTWRRQFAPIRGLNRPRLPSDPSFWTVLAAGLVGAAALGGFLFLFGLLLRLFA